RLLSRAHPLLPPSPTRRSSDLTVHPRICVSASRSSAAPSRSPARAPTAAASGSPAPRPCVASCRDPEAAHSGRTYHDGPPPRRGRPVVMAPAATSRSAVGAPAAIRAVIAASLALAPSLAHLALLPAPGGPVDCATCRRRRGRPRSGPAPAEADVTRGGCASRGGAQPAAEPAVEQQPGDQAVPGLSG